MRVFKNGEFKEKKAKFLYPGEIIKVEQGEEVPADCILLKVTNNRLCTYVETKNIDNETFLSRKNVPPFVEGIHESDPVEFLNLYVNNSVSVDSPSPDLFNFKGSISTVNSSIPIDIGNK